MHVGVLLCGAVSGIGYRVGRIVAPPVGAWVHASVPWMPSFHAHIPAPMPAARMAMGDAGHTFVAPLDVIGLAHPGPRTPTCELFFRRFHLRQHGHLLVVVRVRRAPCRARNANRTSRASARESRSLGRCMARQRARIWAVGART